MAERPRVLIVDDDDDFAHTIMFWLEAKGYPVVRVDNGVKAVELIQSQEPPDVVLLDIMMPQMDGLETLRRIRKCNTTLPVIMVTAAADHDEMKFTESKALGIAGFFPKGNSFSQLGQVLTAALNTLRRPGSQTG